MFKHLGIFLALIAVLFLAVPVVDAMPDDGCQSKQEQKDKCPKCDKDKICEKCAEKCDKCEKGKRCEGCAKKYEGKKKGGCKKGK